MTVLLLLFYHVIVVVVVVVTINVATIAAVDLDVVIIN